MNEVLDGAAQSERSEAVVTWIKQSLMWAYNHGLISMKATQWVYDRLGLSEY